MKTSSQGDKPLHFLLVEDDDDHAHLVTRTLIRHRVTNRIDRARDGAEALDYLFRQGKFKDQELPGVILLDLKLPLIDGHEVLKRIKSDPVLRAIPVVVLTTSDEEADRAKAYNCFANSYLVKPVDFDRFSKMVQDLGFYWGIWSRPSG